MFYFNFNLNNLNFFSFYPQVSLGLYYGIQSRDFEGLLGVRTSGYRGL